VSERLSVGPEMNPVLAELLETGMAVSETGQRQRVHSHIPAEEGRFLQEVISESRPEVSLEIGLGYGVAALFMCGALSKLPKQRHIAIDPYQFRASSTHISFEGTGLYNLRKAGYGWMVELHAEPSYLALPSLVAQGIKVDFAFIDGWHTFDYASVDFFYVDLLLRCGGIVVIDDTDFPSVWELCKYVVTNRAYRVARCLKSADVATRHPVRWSRKNGVRKLARWYWQLTHRDGLKPYSRCIAFRKVAEDNRSWDFHQRF